MPRPWGVLACKLCEWCRNPCELLQEFSEIVGKAQEGANFLYILGCRPLSNGTGLVRIDLDAFL
eukprot:109952-Chlamydomonas_euryale.AAC.1